MEPRGRFTHVSWRTQKDYESWKQRLLEHGVPIVDEIEWGNGVKSFYFRDPAENLLEIADGDLWP
jgi:catechol 2,3-dioxygenase-like lactoylglutathione lyase family enzyme